MGKKSWIIKFLIILLLINFSKIAFAKTAQELIREGRDYLAKHDIEMANECFKEAVNLAPANMEANFFYSATRILSLIYDKKTKELLDRLGIETEGRDIYDWEAGFHYKGKEYYMTISGEEIWGVGTLVRLPNKLWYDYLNMWWGMWSQEVANPMELFCTEAPPLKYLPPEIGQSWTETGYRDGYIISCDVKIVSLNDTVTVTAGQFTDCVKVDEIPNYPEGYVTDHQVYPVKIERWFAPGIGPCMVRVTLNNGNVHVWELVSCENIAAGSDYFPLGVDYTWRFRLDKEKDITVRIESVDTYKDIKSIDLPDNTPTTGEIIQFLNDVLLPEINGALDNLSKINSSFNIILTAQELDTDESKEVDYGDICLYRAILHTLKAIISTLNTYDLNVDVQGIIAKIQNDIFNIKKHLIDAYPNLLTVINNDELLKAKQEILEAIDDYLEGSDFMRAEIDSGDYQGDELIYIDNLEDEWKFRVILNQVKDSLNGEAEERFKVEIAQFLDLSRFFEEPVNLRDFLTTGGIISFLRQHILPQINRALENMETAQEDFNQILSKDDYFVDKDIEIDYGDIAIARACLYAADAAIKILSSYYLDVDLYDIFCRLEWNELYDSIYGLEKKEGGINEIFDLYPELLELNPDHRLYLPEAEISFEKALNEFLQGFRFIEDETDSQYDDLFNRDDLEDVVSTAEALKNALTGPYPVPIGDDTYKINLSRFFVGKDMRDFRCEITPDNKILEGSFPDPTLDEILPEFTQQSWCDVLDICYSQQLYYENGDANADGRINVQDVIAIINVILGRQQASGNTDCNGDGSVNVQDVICVINKILNG